MIEQQVDKHFEEFFKWLCENESDFFDLTIEVKIENDGKTIRRSWKDRNEMLREDV
jgi:hypothetical protein